MPHVGEMEERGVYLARWRTRDGCRVVYAIDSDERIVGYLKIAGTVTYEVAERLLSAKLDEVDPVAVPVLRLVKDETPPERIEKPSAAVTLALCGAIRRQSPPTPA